MKNYIRTAKNELREHYIEKRASLSASEKALLDKKIITNIMSTVSYRFSDTLLAYCPTRGEVDITPLMIDALARGKRLALPKCESVGRMDFHFITSLDELKVGKFGILEPPANSPVFEKDSGKASLMIVPALVFDRLGFRLGYGGGYYDRYINGYSGVKAGLAYSAFVSDKPLPRGRYDVASDFVVTEKGVLIIEKV